MFFLFPPPFLGLRFDIPSNFGSETELFDDLLDIHSAYTFIIPHPLRFSDIMTNKGVFVVANEAKFRWRPLAQLVIHGAVVLKFETNFARVAIDFTDGPKIAVVSASQIPKASYRETINIINMFNHFI